MLIKSLFLNQDSKWKLEHFIPDVTVLVTMLLIQHVKFELTTLGEIKTSKFSIIGIKTSDNLS